MDKSKKNKILKIKQFGYYSKGLVYALMGILAAIVALGLGGDIKGKSGIVIFLQGSPGGIILTSIVSLGLTAYSLWRFYEAIVDPGEEKSRKRIGARIQYAYSGLFYMAIAFSFAKPAFGKSSADNGNSKKAILGQLLDKEWGIWLIWTVAVVMGLNAMWQCYLGISGKYMKQVDQNPINSNEFTWVKNSGKYGYLARGVVFGILSYFIIKVCLDQNAGQYKGTEGAFEYLLNLSYGPFLMGTVALGMIGYGIFCIMVARHANLTQWE